MFFFFIYLILKNWIFRDIIFFIYRIYFNIESHSYALQNYKMGLKIQSLVWLLETELPHVLRMPDSLCAGSHFG